ncbi:twin-arginine translocation signal domain-containing protein [Polaromonas sp. P1(28)-8]|nr:twin-arginine translocation signal domain-containing protein [Polaromonas sp. P1(28)-8]
MPSMQHQAAGPGDAFLPAINALRGLSRRDFLRFSGAAPPLLRWRAVPASRHCPPA